MFPPSLTMSSGFRRPGFVAARSLIALRIEGARISRISRHSHFSLLVLRNSPTARFDQTFSFRRSDYARRSRRIGKSYSHRPCFFRARRGKSSPRLSSSRDLRFLSDFPLEICIMYITARPFRKWETYLRTLPRPRCAAGLTFLSRCFFPFRLLPRLRDFI